MKGIILAGGSGTRLHPITKATSKQLLPIYDVPMIYYPLSILMLAKINEILIITTGEDLENYKKLLGDGSQFGIRIKYEIQKAPEGLVQAFTIGEEFIGKDNVCLILGDNVFYGAGLSGKLSNMVRDYKDGATVFGYRVNDPERFGVVEFDKDNNVVSIEEKPENPKSNYAVVGLYFYDNKVIDYAKNLKKSSRGEYEITDLNNIYLENKKLKVKTFGRGIAWLDTGTHDSLLEAGQFVNIVEKRQGKKIACLEEIAYENGWIAKNDLLKLIKNYNNTNYGTYLQKICEEK